MRIDARRFARRMQKSRIKEKFDIKASKGNAKLFCDQENKIIRNELLDLILKENKTQ